MAPKQKPNNKLVDNSFIDTVISHIVCLCLYFSSFFLCCFLFNLSLPARTLSPDRLAQSALYTPFFWRENKTQSLVKKNRIQTEWQRSLMSDCRLLRVVDCLLRINNVPTSPPCVCVEYSISMDRMPYAIAQEHIINYSRCESWEKRKTEQNICIVLNLIDSTRAQYFKIGILSECRNAMINLNADSFFRPVIPYRCRARTNYFPDTTSLHIEKWMQFRWLIYIYITLQIPSDNLFLLSLGHRLDSMFLNMTNCRW